ncbi:MAG: flagellar hook-basal body complex protein, partial [Aeromonadaceae bacterium]|nr:flagellar hook-basal body complex protein [Aeromonadaceae bacterium]
VDVNKDGLADGTPPTPVAAQVTYNGNPWTGAVITFDDLGVMKSTTPADLYTQALGVDDPSSALAGDGANVLGLGADGTQRLKLNFDTAKTTQFGSKFEVTSLEQDGLTVGRLTGVDVGTDGLVKATYSNGTSQPLARVAMARFSNEQGLRQSGNTSWKESQDSGVALAGEANTGTFGAIKSAALEQSNVNLTAELVDLITAQRNFQANSRALEVNNTLQQSILQIR